MGHSSSAYRIPEITIDARWLRSGLGTYTYNLISRFAYYANGLALRAIVSQENATRIAPFSQRLVISETPIYTLREQLTIPRAALGADLLHVPHYNAPLLHFGKLVVTILDLIHITDPEYQKRPAAQAYARTMLNLAVRKAAHVITISQFSKNQIVERLGVAPSKITVIHCGVESHFEARESDEVAWRLSSDLNLRRPYVLYVGNLKPHKNLERLLRAFALLHSRRAFDLDLLFVSHDAMATSKLKSLAAELGIAERLVFRHDITNELLPWVYAGAQLVAMPSMLEGFGLPVLEAMACGVPVVSSRAASLPEVGGDAVQYFDPGSTEDMASAICRVLTSTDLRAAMRAKGLDRASHFSWDESTRRHCEVYRTVLQS